MSTNLTPEESKGIAEFLKNMLDQMEGKNDTCLHCHASIEDMRQHGRCVYSYPCGCRQYQGTLPEKWRKKK